MVFWDWLQNIEATVLLFLQGLRNPVTDPIMTVFSVPVNYGAVWIAVALLLLCFKKTRLAGLQLGLCLLASLLINNILLKPLVARPRPYNEIAGLKLMLDPAIADAGSWSFPSGHAGASFAAAYSLSRSFWKRGSWVYILALLAAFSRLYIGAHYPTDVLAGMITGTVGAAIAVGILQGIVKAIRKKRGKSPTA